MTEIRAEPHDLFFRGCVDVSKRDIRGVYQINGVSVSGVSRGCKWAGIIVQDSVGHYESTILHSKAYYPVFRFEKARNKAKTRNPAGAGSPLGLDGRTADGMARSCVAWVE